MEWQQLLPPILLPAVSRLRRKSGKRCYASYQQALEASSQHGYENHDLVEVVIRKTLRYRDQLADPTATICVSDSSSQSLVALLAAAEGEGPLHVLDFGGAAGAHYLLARVMLPASRALRWVVVETEAMASAASRALATAELGFSSDLRQAAEELRHVELVHSSGTLQCVADPYRCLRSLLAVGAGHVLLSRLGLTQGDHEVITVHESKLSWNGPGPMPAGLRDRRIRYPFIFPQQALVNEMIGSTYRRKLEFTDSSGIFPVDREPIIGLGLLLERKPESIGS